MRDNLEKYLKNPGTLALSKSLHDIYKHLDLENFREGEESNTANNRSDLAGESENESSHMHLKDHIVRTDNQAFGFEPINPASVVHVQLDQY